MFVTAHKTMQSNFVHHEYADLQKEKKCGADANVKANSPEIYDQRFQRYSMHTTDTKSLFNT